MPSPLPRGDGPVAGVGVGLRGTPVEDGPCPAPRFPSAECPCSPALLPSGRSPSWPRKVSTPPPGSPEDSHRTAGFDPLLSFRDRPGASRSSPHPSPHPCQPSFIRSHGCPSSSPARALTGFPGLPCDPSQNSPSGLPRSCSQTLLRGSAWHRSPGGLRVAASHSPPPTLRPGLGHLQTIRIQTKTARGVAGRL